MTLVSIYRQVKEAQGATPRGGVLRPRMWRSVRRLLPSARTAQAGENIGRVGLFAAGDDGGRRCGASGWRLRGACTEGDGGMLCPLCGRRVGTHPDAVVGRSVRVVKEHRS